MKKNKQKRHTFLKFIPMLVMMGVIFYFSQMQGEESGNLSGSVMDVVLKIIHKVFGRELPTRYYPLLHKLIRKMAHFSEYAVFGWTVIYAFEGLVRNIWVACIFSEALVFFYAMSDELHQNFISGRAMSAVDVGIDSLGALFGIWAFVIFFKIIEAIDRAIQKRKKKKLERKKAKQTRNGAYNETL